MSLDTPWVRDELREHLSRLADQAWLLHATSEELDELLDALDETRVLEDPGDRIGYVLRDEGEAVAMAKLGLRLNYAQQDLTEEGWRSVAEAARGARRARLTKSATVASRQDRLRACGAEGLLQTRAGSVRIVRSEPRGRR